MTLALAAGQTLTADALNARNPVQARMTTTQALTVSSTTMQNVTELVLTLPANRTYAVELNLGAICTVATADIKLDWTVTGTVAGLDNRFCRGPSIAATDAQGLATAATTVGVVRASANHTLTAAVTYGVDATGACGAIDEDFTVTTGASGGVLQLRAAQRVSDPATVTLFTGTLIATPIS